MKTLEETKKGLEICYHSVGCDECPYRYKPWTEGSRCVDGLQSDALAHIKQLESQIPRWIPVEDRLPEAKLAVLGYGLRYAAHDKPDKFPMEHVVYTRGEDEGWFTYWDHHYVKVTHWMPLPEPPEEAKTNG